MPEVGDRWVRDDHRNATVDALYPDGDYPRTYTELRARVIELRQSGAMTMVVLEVYATNEAEDAPPVSAIVEEAAGTMRARPEWERVLPGN